MENKAPQFINGDIITDRYTGDVFYFNELSRWLIGEDATRFRHSADDEKEMLVRSRKNAITINIDDRI